MVNLNLPDGTGPCGISRRKWVIGAVIGVFVTIILIIIIIVASTSGSSAKRTGSSALNDVPLIDGYNNLVQLIRKCAKNDLQGFQFNVNLTDDSLWDNKCKTFTDLLRIEEGKLKSQVWYASAPCEIQYKDATPYVLEQIDVLKRLIDEYSEQMQLVTSISELKNANSNNKLASFIGVDSAHVIDSRLGVLRMLYDLGVRFLTLSSCTDTPWLTKDMEVTAFGKNIISEANRLGIVLDLNGLPTETARKIVKLSDAPVILSHTASKKINDNALNADDNLIREIKIKNGLIMISFDLNLVTKNITPSLDHLFEHFDQIAKESSIESIGIGSGFGLFNKSVPGIDETSKFPNLFNGLYEFKSIHKIDWHSIENLKKIAYKNFERVFTEVEKVRDSKLKELPKSDWIPNSDFTDAFVKEHPEIKYCRSSYSNGKLR